MRWSDLRLRLRSLLFHNRLEQELDEEIGMHIELETRKYLSSGLSPVEARRQAHIALGGTVRASEECRDQRGIALIENLVKDCRYALRSFRRSPGFAITVVLTLAVAVGANTTVFSFCKAVLLSSLPVPNPQDLRLLTIESTGPFINSYFSFPDLRKMQAACRSLASLTGFTEVVEVHVGNDSGTTSTIKGQLVADNFFSALEVMPLAGRLFTAEDNRAGAAPVAAISYKLWEERFNHDPAAIGKQIRVQQTPVTVVAVMPARFEGVEPGVRPDIWMPLSIQSQIGYQGYASMDHVDWKKPWMWQDVYWLHVLARSPHDPNGRRLYAALTEFIKREVAAQLPQVSDTRDREMMLRAKVRLTSATGGLPRLREQFSLPLRILLALVGVLLFCGCVNLTNLLLARAQAHRHETALRIALGSSRARLVAYQLTEITLLTTAGGVLSLPLAAGSAGMILHWLAMGQDLAIDVRPDWAIFAFAAAVTMLSGLLVATVPARRVSDLAISPALGQRSQSGSGGKRIGRSLLTPALTAGQLALSIVSLVVAGLLTHTLVNYARLDVGMDRSHVLSVGIDPSAAGYNNAAKSNALYQQLTANIDRIPGVISSSVGGCGLLGGGCATIQASVVGRQKGRPEESLVERNYVGPHYFSTVGMELLQGREIAEEDRLHTPAIGVVNQTFERQFCGGQSALGKIVDADEGRFRIVGVVRDARSADIHRAAMPFLYLPVQQAPGGWNVSHLEIRTETNPLIIAAPVRRAILSINRAIPISEVATLAEETNRQLARELLVGRLAGLFSIVTLIIAGLGLYGVLAYEVSQRRAEIAVRMALGATRRAVVRLVLAKASGVWALGCAAGLLLSGFASRLVNSLLFGTGEFDPWTYGGSLAILLVASITAAIAPAWRASSVDPASALRAD